ncbi:MAG: sigma-70 family RNA polymerase sigma factor [Balneolaceae bacterium]|nr:sigma-70 family RNA polymerase sigma factor [Balneolaceae bacterium]
MPDKKIYTIRDGGSDEQELWERFLEGDLNAWHEIFKCYYEDLYGYGLKLSNQKELTRDCIHQLFVTIWDRKDKLAQVDSIKAYLLASLRRSLLKKITKRRKYYVTGEDSPDLSTKIQFSPEVILIRDEVKAEKVAKLYEAIDQLPDRQKEVLYLKYFNGMSYEEIEAILSIQYQSIKNHVYRAISKLRDIMGDEISKIAISITPIWLFFEFYL